MSPYVLVVLLQVAVPPAGVPIDSQSPLTAPGEWVVSSSLATGGAGGGYGDVVEKPVDFDLNLARIRGPWRLGIGFQFGSLVMKPPYQAQEDWSRLETHFFATRFLRHEGRVRPYIQGHLALERVHPRSTLFHVIPEEEFAEGHNPTKSANGVGVVARPGAEIMLTPAVALDVSAAYTLYSTTDLSLDPIGLPPVDSGNEWAVRAGLAWRPLAEGVPRLPAPATDPATGKLAALPPASDKRDAWGVPRSWGWASAEMLGINFVSSWLNEYTRGESSYPITPRTIQHNFEQGFKYDDNEFQTNQLIHPFNGAMYFNSARTNGIGFWGSAVMALAGAFIWECCGESQPMSWNDMVSTGIGGISRGEVAYRLGSMILDNTLTGSGRVWTEVAATPVNLPNQFNRFVSGRATRVTGNPANPYDWRPPAYTIQLALGLRIIGEGESITDNTNTYGVAELDLFYGNAFENTHRRPFDRFDTAFQLNFGEKSKVGRVQIRGDLWSMPLGGAAGPQTRHALAVIQDFDYINNEAYEYGGQAFGLGLYSRFGRPERLLTTRLVGYGVASAAVNADYSFLAEIPNPRQLRDYDYGGGVGGGAEMALTRRGRPLGTLGYRYTLISVKNGSLYNPSGGPEGAPSTHQVHRASLRVTVPVREKMSVGFDSWLFLRNSNYDSPELIDQSQRNPEARIYLAWTPAY